MSDPLLSSVCLITYNQAKYIREAIDGVLMQKVNFAWELIIADDFSTDGTREIVLEYKEKYPEFIKLILQEKNVGAAQNWLDLLAAPSSKYVACFEGDDYWTNPLKLQMQVDFLESNPQFVMCFTDCSVVDENGVLTDQVRVTERMKRTIRQQDITLGTPPTLTVLFRNNLIKSFPEEIYRVANGDMFFSFMLTEYGDAGYIDKKTACYRMHSGGVWSLQTGEFRHLNNLIIRKILLKYSGNKDWDIHLPQVNGYYRELLTYYRREKKYAKFIGTFLSYVRFRIKYTKAL